MTGGVGLFGGSFNPIHVGHLIVARAVAEHLALERLVLIPSAQPPHKRGHDLADAADRLEMVRLAVDGEPRLEVSDVEIRREGPSYTFLTVQAFRDDLGPDAPLYWIVGGDSLPELHTWYRIAELVELCTIVTAVRPGYETPDLSPLERVLTRDQIDRLQRNVLPTPRIDVAATDVRRRRHAGQSIRYLVPDPVLGYIEEHGLYAPK